MDEVGHDVLNTFYSLRNMLNEWSDPIQPRLILDWFELSGDYLSRDISSIIIAMDVAYRSAMSELAEKMQKRE